MNGWVETLLETPLQCGNLVELQGNLINEKSGETEPFQILVSHFDIDSSPFEFPMLHILPM